MVLFLFGFYEILPVFWKQLKRFSYYSCPVEAIMIWLTKQMNILPN